jgi:hypothetical protein
MMKKFLTGLTVASGIFLSLLAADLSAVDQSSKKAVLESCINAASSSGGADILWKILPPETKKMWLKANQGDPEKIKLAITVTLMDHRYHITQNAEKYRDPETREKLLETLLAKEEFFACANGKYYVDFNILIPIISQEDKEAQIELVLRFFDAAADQDFKTAWQCFSPASQEKLLKEYGSMDKCFDHFRMSEEKASEVKQQLADPEIRKKIGEVFGNSGFPAEKIDGKWFLSVDVL